MTNEAEKRQKQPKSEFQKQLEKVRKISPSHVVEIELNVLEFQHWNMQRIGEQLRFIRNTVLSELFKNYKQMIRTKKYKRALKSYRSILEQIEKEKDSKVMKELEKMKKELADTFESLRNLHNVTFDFAHKYGEQIRKTTFNLPDSVTVWSVCEMAWNSMELFCLKMLKNRIFINEQI